MNDIMTCCFFMLEILRVTLFRLGFLGAISIPGIEAPSLNSILGYASDLVEIVSNPINMII